MVGALCAGFVLAQAPTRRSNQLVAALVLGASAWALANANADAARDAEAALAWYRIATPGWAFIGGLLPHIGLRYFETYPRADFVRIRRGALVAAIAGYAAGVVIVLGAWLVPDLVFRELHRVPWGWTHVPGPLQLAYFAVAVPCGLSAFPGAYYGFRSSVAVAPLSQRLGMYVSMAIPANAIGVTEILLPMARIDFPRLGAASYALFGLICVVAVLRYGVTFITSNRFSHEILDTVNEGVAMLTASGRVRHVNRSLVRMTGLDVDDLIGGSVDVLFEPGAAIADGVLDAPARLRVRDGEAVPVSLSVAALQDQQGNDLGRVVVARDMREIEGLRRQMVTQARLAAVGELAAGVAHEINNPLAFVRANLGLLEGSVKALSGAVQADRGEARAEIARDALEAIEESIEGVDRVTTVVQGVRRFTDSGQLQREPAKLDALVEDAVGMARLQDRSGRVAIEIVRGAPPEIACAPRDLRQALLNLLVNAVEATAPPGTIRVTTRRDGDEVVAEIVDQGPGLRPSEIARVFDPFYTTKQAGEGTGLGLTIAWHVVAAHGGTIDVESRVGEGSTFRVRLPIEDAPVASG